jgi:predicted DNA-binding transcriptional regulator YafY
VTRRLKAQDRLIQIIIRIVHHPRRYTARQLAEAFGVSVRTIRRDIQALERAGLSIRSGDGGGYFILSEARWLPHGLMPEEQLALHVIPLWLDVSAQADAAPLLKAYRSALDKLVHKAGVDLQSDWAAVAGRILPEPTSEAKHSPQVLQTLLEAMASQRTVWVRYHNFSRDEVTDRLVDPYLLIPRQNSLYVFGYCHLREDYRIFKVGRILEIRATPHPFVIEDDVDIQAELRTAWSIDTSGEVVEAELAVSPRIRRYVEEELAGRALVSSREGTDGWWHVVLRRRLNAEFLRWILQFGPELEVLAPPQLRASVTERVRRMARLYDGR